MTLRDDAAAMVFDQDTSVRVVYRDCVTRGTFDTTRTLDADGSTPGRYVTRRLLTVLDGTLGTPVRDTPITIDGKPYRILDRMPDQGEIDGLHEFWEIVGA